LEKVNRLIAAFIAEREIFQAFLRRAIVVHGLEMPRIRAKTLAARDRRTEVLNP